MLSRAPSQPPTFLEWTNAPFTSTSSQPVIPGVDSPVCARKREPPFDPLRTPPFHATTASPASPHPRRLQTRPSTVPSVDGTRERKAQWQDCKNRATHAPHDTTRAFLTLEPYPHPPLQTVNKRKQVNSTTRACKMALSVHLPISDFHRNGHCFNGCVTGTKLCAQVSKLRDEQHTKQT